MSEVNRILGKGIFQENFLNGEIISDFYVDEKRKALWLISLDLLSEFDRVCRKHKLRYVLFWGSLLGAIRHKGIIPWDDDIDVAMPREDYEVLMSLGNEFSLPYFLQTPYTDIGYFYSLNKLRNSNTSCVPLLFQYEKFNQGIGLDIFPLDSYKSRYISENFERSLELILDLGTYMRMRNPELSEKDKVRVSRYSGRKPIDTYEMVRNICMAYKNKNADCFVYISGNIYGWERQTFPIDIFDSIEYIDFYGLSIPVPSTFDNILRTIYGDYMKLPPIEQRGIWHHNVIFDAYKPYKYYLK